MDRYRILRDLCNSLFGKNRRNKLISRVKLNLLIIYTVALMFVTVVLILDQVTSPVVSRYLPPTYALVAAAGLGVGIGIRARRRTPTYFVISMARVVGFSAAVLSPYSWLLAEKAPLEVMLLPMVLATLAAVVIVVASFNINAQIAKAARKRKSKR